MMILRCIQTIKVPPEQAGSDVGPVPIVGQAVVVTRAWYQCDRCGLIGALDGMASPMMPPPCAQGCDPEEVT